MPWCFGNDASWRASRSPQRAYEPRLVQTFWPFTAPLVAVAHGARREPGEVGSGARLREQLAPDLLAGRDRGQPAGALIGVAVHEQRRADELEPDEVRVEVGDGEGGELGADDADLLGRGAEAAVLGGPARRREAGPREGLQVRAPGFEVVGAGAEDRRVRVVPARVAAAP